MALYDYDRIKPILKLEKDDISDYPALEVIADSVEARIEDYLGRELTSQQRSETIRVRGYSTDDIPLKALPVDSVASVTVDGSATTGYDLSIWGLEMDSKLSKADVVVTYTGGFAEAPEWLHRALTVQIAYEYQNKDHMGADYVSTEGGSVGRPALQLLPEVRKTLDPHRHPARLF